MCSGSLPKRWLEPEGQGEQRRWGGGESTTQSARLETQHKGRAGRARGRLRPWPADCPGGGEPWEGAAPALPLSAQRTEVLAAGATSCSPAHATQHWQQSRVLDGGCDFPSSVPRLTCDRAALWGEGEPGMLGPSSLPSAPSPTDQRAVG